MDGPAGEPGLQGPQLPETHAVSDVFISYAREDRASAQALAQALEARGLTVWWDRVIPPGRQFDEVIEEQLDIARCVVVLWSGASAASKWVKAEAGEALQHEKLVPALISPGVRLPLEFRRVQAADLAGWQPGQPSPALDEFCTAVAAAVATAAQTMRTHSRARKAAAAPPPPPPPPPVAPPPVVGTGARKTWVWVAAGVVGVAVLAVALRGRDEPQPSPGPSPAPAPAPSPIATQGLDTPLRWRDYLFAYEGRVQWDGRQSVATVDLRAIDSGNGQVIAQGRFGALLVPNTGSYRVFYVKVDVPRGDSRTLGPHFHDNHLVFEPGPGGRWVFARNCMQLNRPDSCFQ